MGRAKEKEGRMKARVRKTERNYEREGEIVVEKKRRHKTSGRKKRDEE